MTAVKFIDFKSKTANPNVPSVFDISSEDLKSNKDKVVIVDVRRPDEWVGEYGHIPEAQHIILDNLPMRIGELPKDQTIVFVCRSGARSAQASAFAQENGFQSVYNMKGGMIDWTQKNFETAGRNNS